MTVPPDQDGPSLPSCPTTHLKCQFPGQLLSHEGLFWGPRSGVPARSWSLQSSWSVAHLSLDLVLSCWESRETMSEGELITPESSVVSSDAKQLPTDTVSSASEGSRGAPSMPQGLPGRRGRLTGQNTARTGQPTPQCLHHPTRAPQSAQHTRSVEFGVPGIEAFKHGFLQKRFSLGSHRHVRDGEQDFPSTFSIL